MTHEDVYLVTTHRYSYRPGKPAKIIGVKMITLFNKNKRLCYHIRWADGMEDYVPINDSKNYEIITFEDILTGNIPKI